MITFIALVLAMVLLIKINSLSNRVTRLETLLSERTTTAPVSNVAPAPATDTPASGKVPLPPPPPVAPAVPIAASTDLIPRATMAPVSSTPAAPSALMAWFRENTLIKAGAFIFFLGAVWFVSYAITQGWLSPEARIYLGLLLGAVVMIVGAQRRLQNEQHYLTLTLLGGGIAIASVYAGQLLFAVFLPLVAGIILLITIAYVVWVSLNTKTQWLCALAMVAGLLTPILAATEPDPQPFIFFSYLFLLCAGFLSIVFVTHWRSVALIAVIGVGLYQLMYTEAGYITDNLLWFFVVLFSALFLASISISLFKSDRPQSADIAALGLQSLLFIGFASEIALSPAVASFIAAAIVAGVGYQMVVAKRSAMVQAVYAMIALLYVLVGTSHLFSGYTLALAYLLEVTVVVLLGLMVRLPRPALITSALVYVVPLIATLPSLTSDRWDTGIWHADALVLYTTVASLWLVGVVAWRRSVGEGVVWLQHLAGTFFLVGWCYMLITVGVVAKAAIATDAARNVMLYLTWTFFTVGPLLLAGIVRAPAGWQRFLQIASLLPVFVSIGSLEGETWNGSLGAIAAIGLYMMLAVALLSTVWFWQRARAGHEIDRAAAAGAALLSIFYLYTISSTIWDVTIADRTLESVLRFVSWSVISYGALLVSLTSRASSTWLLTMSLTFVLPVLVSLSTLLEPAYKGLLAPEAVGLYLLTTTFCFVAATLRQYAQGSSETDWYRALATVFYGLMALYAARLTWQMSHTVFASGDYAVTVALLVYTVVGLFCYSVGRSREQRELRFAGIVILSGTVLRLLLIDVWDMEVLWRIVTFLGVGALFIATALLERPLAASRQEQSSHPENDLPEPPPAQ